MAGPRIKSGVDPAIHVFAQRPMCLAERDARIKSGLASRSRRLCPRSQHPYFVMAGLDPAIHVSPWHAADMDARIKSGHDDMGKRLVRGDRALDQPFA